MGVALDELATGVEAIAALDVEALDDASLTELVVGLARQQARLAAAYASVVRRWEASAAWAADGSRTAATALARDTKTSVRRAGAELHRARALATMPATMAALNEGRFSTEYVDLLARANRSWRHAVFADHEGMLVDQIAGLRYEPARRVIEYWIQHADARAADERAQRQRDAAHVHASTTIDGNVVIDGVLDPVRGAIVTNELSRLEHELYLADRTSGVVRTASQRRADALALMAARSSGATGTPARPLFTVVVGDESLARLCELGNGTVIAPGALLPWMCTAMLESVVFDGPSTVVSVSKRRTFTGAIRRAIQVRDRHCQHPSGCDVPAHECDVDHITPWSVTRHSAPWDARLQCPPHNRDATKHDRDARPFPVIQVGRLDELRVRLRWRADHAGDDDTDADAADDDDGSSATAA